MRQVASTEGFALTTLYHRSSSSFLFMDVNWSENVDSNNKCKSNFPETERTPGNMLQFYQHYNECIIPEITVI